MKKTREGGLSQNILLYSISLEDRAKSLRCNVVNLKKSYFKYQHRVSGDAPWNTLSAIPVAGLNLQHSYFPQAHLHNLLSVEEG